MFFTSTITAPTFLYKMLTYHDVLVRSNKFVEFVSGARQLVYDNLLLELIEGTTICSDERLRDMARVFKIAVSMRKQTAIH